MKRIFSLLLAWVMICGILPLSAFADDVDGTATASPITSVVDPENRTVTWDFAETTPEAEKTVYDVTNEYAALRVGLGSVEDKLTASGISFHGAGCLEPTDATNPHASASGRYILLRTTYAGTVSFDALFGDTNARRSKRVYMLDMGEVSNFDDLDLTRIKKDGTVLVTATNQSVAQQASFRTQANHVYSLVTYNVSSSELTNFVYVWDEQPESGDNTGGSEGGGSEGSGSEGGGSEGSGSEGSGSEGGGSEGGGSEGSGSEGGGSEGSGSEGGGSEGSGSEGSGSEGSAPSESPSDTKAAFSFEEEDALAGWTVTDAELCAEGYDGAQGLLIRSGSASVTVTDIPQGSYTVSLWLKGSAGSARLEVSGTGGPDSVLKLSEDKDIQASAWTQAAHRNVLVYNGQMTVSLTNAAGLYIDKMEITLDSADENPVTNWNFEDELTGWNTIGSVEVTDQADTGSKAARLGDQARLYQTISVEPDTDYIATARVKVDREDTFSSELQYSLDGTTKLGMMVTRQSIGNRINLGVMDADSVVLRQAPASTADYTLLTIAFHTGKNQTQAVIYLNTQCDDAYKESVTVYENTNGTYPNGYQKPDPTNTNNTHLADDWTGNGTDSAYVDNIDLFKVDNTYIKGADMAFLQVIEDCGGKYFANGVQQDALRILSNHGVNSVMSMIFVHSGNDIYDWNSLTPLSASVAGYAGETVSGRQQVYDYFDETHITALALRCQALGMSFAPSFHYSDTWISAAKAHMPLDWIEEDYEGTLSNPDLSILETAVYNYVHDFLSDMKEAGVENLAFVKDGNEQDGGLVFPVGSGANQAAIITASSKAVQEVYPGVLNIIHTNTGYDTTQLTSFFGALLDKGADFDGMGFSLYAGRDINSQLKMMKAASGNDTLKRYDYINVETGVSFTKSTIVGDAGGITNNYYDVSPTGQYNYLLDYMQAPLDMPNPYGVQRGFYFWDAEGIAVYGAGHKQGEAISGTVRTLFNNGTASIHEMGCNQDGKMGDMTLGMYAYLHRGKEKAVSADVYTPLKSQASTYTLSEPTAITAENTALAMKVGERERLSVTISPADALLTDYGVNYTSSDSHVAEVSQQGIVSAVAPGTATITAAIGTVQTSVTVTVTEATAVQELAISYQIVRDGEAVTTGTITQDAEISALPYDKIKLTPTLNDDATDREIVFTMDNDSVSSGLAEWYGTTWQTNAKEMRTQDITYSTANKNAIVQLNPRRSGTVAVSATAAGASLHFTVNITEIPVTSIVIGGEDTVQAGKTLQLSAAVQPANATLNKVIWSSSDTSVATVDDNGLVTALQPGTFTVTAKSYSYPDVTTSKEITVTEVKAQEILLSRSTATVQVGKTLALSATILPANTVDKTVTWSSSSNAAAVDENGTVTGTSVGTATIVATANSNPSITAVCTVTVQAEAIAADDLTLSEHKVWLKSSYFSPSADGKAENEPTYQLRAAFAPENATETELVWSSDNEAVATVDENGVVTAHKGGVATITAATPDGRLTDAAVVYVPTVSEDWENFDSGTAGGFTAGNTFTGTVVENAIDGQSLQVSVKGKTGSKTTIQRYSFTPAAGETVAVDFTWNVGHFTADSQKRGAHLSIEDEKGNAYLALASFPTNGTQQAEMVYYYKNDSTAFTTGTTIPNYIHGGTNSSIANYSDCVNVGQGILTGADQTYNIHLELDFVNRTISFTVTDVTNPAITATVSGLTMDETVAYTDSVGAIAFSHYFNKPSGSWTTQIDDLGVYSTTVSPETMTCTVDCVNLNETSGIKLVPVQGALSSTAKINPSIQPSAASQEVVYTVSGDAAAWLTISENGTVEIRPDKFVAYENATNMDNVTGTIRAASKVNPSIYKEIPILIGKPNTNERITLYADGEAYAEAVLERTVGQDVQLSYEATGGDGNSDIYTAKWTVVSGNAEITDDVLKVASAGNVTVQLEIDLFRGMLTKTMYLNFEDPVETDPGVNPDTPSGGNEKKDEESSDSNKENVGDSGDGSKNDSENSSSSNVTESASSVTSSDRAETNEVGKVEQEEIRDSASSSATDVVQNGGIVSASNSEKTTAQNADRNLIKSPEKHTDQNVDSSSPDSSASGAEDSENTPASETPSDEGVPSISQEEGVHAYGFYLIPVLIFGFVFTVAIFLRRKK